MALLLPSLSIFGVHFTVRGDLNGFSLGIVNEEVKSQIECLNSSIEIKNSEKSQCILHKASCKFTDLIDDEFVEKVSSLEFASNSLNFDFFFVFLDIL